MTKLLFYPGTDDMRGGDSEKRESVDSKCVQNDVQDDQVGQSV